MPSATIPATAWQQLPPGTALSLNQAVARDPLPEEPAHGVVYGQKKRGGIGGKLRDGATWVVTPVQSEMA